MDNVSVMTLYTSAGREFETNKGFKKGDVLKLGHKDVRVTRVFTSKTWSNCKTFKEGKHYYVKSAAGEVVLLKNLKRKYLRIGINYDYPTHVPVVE